jgi:hypothetical protein
MLVENGEKRGRHYRASPWLVALREATRATKTTTDPFA